MEGSKGNGSCSVEFSLIILHNSSFSFFVCLPVSVFTLMRQNFKDGKVFWMHKRSNRMILFSTACKTRIFSKNRVLTAHLHFRALLSESQVM